MKLQSEFSREFLKTIFARLPPLVSAARTLSLRLCEESALKKKRKAMVEKICRKGSLE